MSPRLYCCGKCLFWFQTIQWPKYISKVECAYEFGVEKHNKHLCHIIEIDKEILSGKTIRVRVQEYEASGNLSKFGYSQ
jgi:hypothetical protein